MKGSIRQRASGSFMLRVTLGRGPDGKRRTACRTHIGTKRSAQLALAAMVAEVDQRKHVKKSAVTVAQYVTSQISLWEKLGQISALTAERYHQLNDNQISPHLSAAAMQDLEARDIQRWHATLRTAGRKDGQGGLAPQTVKHAHKLLSRALKDAQRFKLVSENVVVGEKPPKIIKKEIEILTAAEIKLVMANLDRHPIFVKGAISLLTGLRRGEISALRWASVDFERKLLLVRESLEETIAGGLRFKPPKSDAGRRDVSLTDTAVKILRDHRRAQMEQRLALGVGGKLSGDALVFGAIDGAPISPRLLTKQWRLAAARIGIRVGFHSLRHSHASVLIASGVDVVKVSKRLGHADVATTLRVYSHLFESRADKSADAIGAALEGLLNEPLK